MPVMSRTGDTKQNAEGNARPLVVMGTAVKASAVAGVLRYNGLEAGLQGILRQRGFLPRARGRRRCIGRRPCCRRRRASAHGWGRGRRGGRRWWGSELASARSSGVGHDGRCACGSTSWLVRQANANAWSKVHGSLGWGWTAVGHIWKSGRPTTKGASLAACANIGVAAGDPRVARDGLFTFLAIPHPRNGGAGPTHYQASSVLNGIAQGAHHALLTDRLHRGLDIICNDINCTCQCLIDGLQHIEE